ncbi:MAG TPA: hypothetical protein VK206_22765 [Anaerolineales bacterium]|nr:hypothetical protein [Anaerolineales bacterium]
MDKTTLARLITQYKSDPESVYNTWFIGGEERMKAFRSIRRGVRDTVDSIVAERLALISKVHLWKSY